jgi:molecular chaperone GrpE
MDDMAAPLPGSLAVRMAQARAQRLKELERRVSEAAPLPPAPDDADGAPQSADVVAPGPPDAPPVAGGAVPGSVRDDADERATSRWTFAEPDDVEETESDAPVATSGGLTPADDAEETESDAPVATSGGLTPADELRLARTEIAQLHAQARRAQEELASIRRRSERDREDLGHTAKSDAIIPMLPIVDDLERALAHVPAALRDDPWVAGIMMIGDSLQRVLERQGVERVAPCQAPFDPHLHEAVAHVEATDVAQDTVIQVYRPGYMYNGRVLRAAQVQVAVKKEQ